MRERAHALLAELRIEDLADRPYGVRPGGRRARLLIARALMAGPGLPLLDEPFHALDLPSFEDLIGALRHLAGSRPKPARVTVTHHLEELSPAITHALLLREGSVLARGVVEEVLTREPMTACSGRSIEVTRHAGRWPARSGGFG